MWDSAWVEASPARFLAPSAFESSFTPEAYPLVLPAPDTLSAIEAIPNLVPIPPPYPNNTPDLDLTLCPWTEVPAPLARIRTQVELDEDKSWTGILAIDLDFGRGEISAKVMLEMVGMGVEKDVVEAVERPGG